MTNKILEKAQEFLINKINPSFIIVFGSFANGTTHKESDIDIAFYNKERDLSSYEVFMLAQELADILKMDVDLVDLTHASTVFQAQIFSTGKVIFSNDETLRMNIEMRSLSMYAKLNEERKLILENVDESGTIYEK
ncbi:nucleotidyltransferase domain-containing protein [Bacillus sp. EB600]|uniref:type VII toxin-antitoxin system MntA family adenylyltransferase antitoxin n=1 Tax=Bacillus sp. EB600 TaxID=2806345 RepID=UPI00210E8AB8|nr:nucleotidyltransferase domain-containing protein [Bacillus sp. EB600]MCQ6282812.1 nucleotidyltransferase domain-containing protein [Bacillus sp. EB600]